MPAGRRNFAGAVIAVDQNLRDPDLAAIGARAVAVPTRVVFQLGKGLRAIVCDERRGVGRRVLLQLAIPAPLVPYGIVMPAEF
jgi:hypothetical protein